jgi:hypothetical protein
MRAFAVGVCVLVAGCGDAVDDESVGGAPVPAVTAQLSVQRAKWEAAGSGRIGSA